MSAWLRKQLDKIVCGSGHVGGIDMYSLNSWIMDV
jgi:hypothetical protein